MKFSRLLFQTTFCAFCLTVCSGIYRRLQLMNNVSGKQVDICNTCLNENGEFQSDCFESIRCQCRATTLDCSTSNLKNLPSNLTFPRGINVAVFKDNKLVDIKDDTFYNGRDIIELDLSDNEIDFISVNAFVSFTNLKRLLLNHNQLWHLPPNVFDGLHQLTNLDLSFNAMKLLMADAFVQTTELRELRLEANPLRELEPKQFEHLTKLEYLDLESTLVTNLSDYMFSFTPKLKILGLADNQLQIVPSKALRALKNLKSLDLSGNPIPTIESGAFDGLQKLLRLHLNRMPLLKYIKKHAFADLKNLRELHCSYNYQLSFIDKDAFMTDVSDEGTNLEVITLRQNNLETLPQDLLKWSHTTELHLDGNAWNCDCRMKWVTHVILKNKFQHQARCTNPSQFRDRLLSSLKDTDFTCEISTSGVVFLICLSALSVLILMAVVGCFVYKRKHVRYEEPQFRVFKKSDVDEVIYERSFKP